MLGRIDRDWLRALRDNVLANLLATGLLALGALIVGVTIAVGTGDATLPLWLVVLFALIQVGTIAALVVLWRRVGRRSGPSADAAPPRRHPHSQLLRRIDALRKDTANRNPYGLLEWTSAATFNGILKDACAAIQTDELDKFPTFDQGVSDVQWVEQGNYGDLQTHLGQIRAVVEHINGAE